MADFRVYCTPPTPEPAQLQLSADESHHLVVVNRARAGDPVVAFNGRGVEWDTELAEARKQAAVLRVKQRREFPPLPHALTLAQALPKGAVMDTIVRKATELGVARIVPLETERTQVHLSGERSERKTDKWHVAALEAAKQCGNPFLPDIAAPQGFDAFTAHVADDLRLIASLAPGARSLKNVLADFRQAHRRAPNSAVWLIGPEGDFSPAEIEEAVARGFQPVTLGPLVLRSDTAAVYALSILSYELQNP